jgi:hypothetical protein
MKRLFIALFVLAGALTGTARAQAPVAAKIAISSLVGDTLTVTVYRAATGSNLSNPSNILKVPGPLLDIALLKAAEEAVGKAAPDATVLLLKVAVAGSSVDPAAVVADDKVVAGNVLVDALRQQGFTHLLTATKYRHNNVIRLADSSPSTGRGQLEGMGFYVDPSLPVQSVRTSERSVGIIAPYLYIQLRLVDLATMEVRTQTITASSVAAAARNKTGMDAWGALTAEEKMKAAESLINSNVARAVPALFQPK